MISNFKIIYMIRTHVIPANQLWGTTMEEDLFQWDYNQLSYLIKKFDKSENPAAFKVFNQRN